MVEEEFVRENVRQKSKKSEGWKQRKHEEEEEEEVSKEISDNKSKR